MSHSHDNELIKLKMTEEDDFELVCEDCEETGPDVEMRTAPSIGWMTEPPDRAVLCDGCEDRRLNPRDYAGGPDRHNEDGCDDD